jgi:hypothetical protein
VIRHIVLFRFGDDVAEHQRRQLLDELATFPDRFPTMQGWALGENISQRDDTFTHGFTVEFATEKDLRSYLDSDEHERFVRESWRPIIARRAIVSFDAP